MRMGNVLEIGGVVAAIALALVGTAAAFKIPLFSKLAAETHEVRYAPFAATLPDGNVLIAGNDEKGPGKTTAELFNVKTDTFEALTGASHELQEGRGEAAAVTLRNGEVLIVGGYSSPTYLVTAELFNPATETFKLLSAHLTEERDAPGVALLHNGNVLIADGCQAKPCNKTAELYEPSSQTFTKLAAATAESRYAPAAATLPDGNVLIAGGDEGSHSSATAEIYNVKTGNFELLTGVSHEMHEARGEAPAVALQDGKVLIVGGWVKGKALKTVEVFNPATNTFEPAPSELIEARDTSATALLHDGRVLVADGCQESCATSTKSAEITSVNAPSRATTGRTTRRSSRSARVTAFVEAETVSTVYFQFGASRRYRHRTRPQKIQASETSLRVSALLTRLTPGKRYHYRVVVESVGGKRAGRDRTFIAPKRR